MRNALSDAHLTASDRTVDEVLLVGGSTRIPAVQASHANDRAGASQEITQ